MVRRKEEKEHQQKEEVDELERALATIEEDSSQKDQVLKDLDFSSVDEIKKRLKKLKIKLGLVTKEDLVSRRRV